MFDRQNRDSEPPAQPFWPKRAKSMANLGGAERQVNGVMLEKWCWARNRCPPLGGGYIRAGVAYIGGIRNRDPDTS